MAFQYLRSLPTLSPPTIETTYSPLSQLEVTQFKEMGFLKILTLAPPSDVVRVRSIIDALYMESGRPYGPLQNLLSLAPELKASTVFHSCLGIAKQLLGRSAGYACDVALYKAPQGKHGTAWHQDAGFSGKYFSPNNLVFWVPLHDVGPENGCMHYIPLQPQQALLPHRPFLPNDYASMMTDDVDPSLAIACPLPLGAASVHGPLTLHSTLANTTDTIRRAWTLTFRPWGKWGFLTPERLLREARALHDRMSNVTDYTKGRKKSPQYPSELS